jgi:hypothetical protein
MNVRKCVAVLGAIAEASGPESTMFDERVRAMLPRAVMPVIRLLARAGVTPNAVSVVAFGASLAAGVLVATGLPWTAIGVWLASRVGGGPGGVLARETGRSSSPPGWPRRAKPR